MQNRNSYITNIEIEKQKVIEQLEYISEYDIDYMSKNTLDKMHATDEALCEFYKKHNDCNDPEIVQAYRLRNTEYIQTVANTLFETARELILNIPDNELNLSANNPNYNRFTQFSNHLARLVEEHVLSAQTEDARLLAIESFIWVSKVAFKKGDLNSVSNIMASLDSICTVKNLRDLPISKSARKFVIEWQKNYNASTKTGKENLAGFYKSSRVNAKPIIPILASYAGVMEVAKQGSFLSTSTGKDDVAVIAKRKLSISKGKTAAPNAESDLKLFQSALEARIPEVLINDDLKEILTNPILKSYRLLDTDERKKVEKDAKKTITARKDEYKGYENDHQQYIKRLENEIKKKQEILEAEEHGNDILKSEIQVLQEKLKNIPKENDSMRSVNRNSTQITNVTLTDLLDSKRYENPIIKDEQFAESAILNKFSKGVFDKKQVRKPKVSSTPSPRFSRLSISSGVTSNPTSPVNSRLSLASGPLTPQLRRKEEQKHVTLQSIKSTEDLTKTADTFFSRMKSLAKNEQAEEKEGRLKSNRSQSFG